MIATRPAGKPHFRQTSRQGAAHGTCRQKAGRWGAPAACIQGPRSSPECHGTAIAMPQLPDKITGTCSSRRFFPN